MSNLIYEYNIDHKNKVLDFITTDYKKNIDSVTFIYANNDCMLILNLNRDQHLRFKKLAEDLLFEFENLKSIYVKYLNKYYHIGGTEYLSHILNNQEFKTNPYFKIEHSFQFDFYQKIKALAPIGKTRNAIVLDSHAGILSYHLAHLFNKINSIDSNKEVFNLSKLNLKENGINNVLSFNSNFTKWLNDFQNHKHTLPGKKLKVGLFISDYSSLNEDIISILNNIKPETIMFYSKENDFSKIKYLDGYALTYETKIEIFNLVKLMRREC